MRGITLIELLIVLLLIGTVCAITIPRIDAVVDHWRTRGAAFFMASRVALTRTNAVQRNANVGLRFEAQGTAFSMRAYADGNRNGVRVAEIQSGVDPAVAPADRLDHLFPGVTFGFVAGARLIDGTPVGPADDPIRFGSVDTVTFSPLGTATSGTMYLRGRGSWQYAVVVLGATGRSRVLRFDPGTRTWNAP